MLYKWIYFAKYYEQSNYIVEWLNIYKTLKKNKYHQNKPTIAQYLSDITKDYKRLCWFTQKNTLDSWNWTVYQFPSIQ